LRHYLAPSLGLAESDLEIAAAPPPGDGDLIVVGSRLERYAAQGLDTLPAPRFPSTHIGAFRLYRTRLGAHPAWVIEGRERVGTLYGTYAFLERLGWRWNGLGVAGEVRPHPVRALPATLRVAEAPGFLYRGFWAFEPRGTPELMLWMARNRMNLWTDRDTALVPLARKLGIELIGGQHDVQAVCLDPARRVGGRTLFELHPEWYGLHEGKRSSHIGIPPGDNFCTSNDAAVAAFCDELVRELDHGRWRNADELALWMNDNGRWCECDACRALGPPADRVLRLAGQVARAIAAARRDGRLGHDVRLSTLAFLETFFPPKSPVPGASGFTVTFFPMDRCYAHALADPSCTDVNQLMESTFAGWTTDPGRAYRGPVAVGEYYNIGDFRSFPIVLTRVIGADVPAYYAAGVREFHFMHVLHRDWGPWAINHVLLARLLWNPALRADSVRRAFIVETYPASAAVMDTFYASLETASANLKLLKSRVRVGNLTYQLLRQLRQGGVPLPLRHMRLESYHPATDDAPDLDETLAAMRQAAGALARARRIARDPVEVARLEEIRHRFEYGDVTLSFIAEVIYAVLAERAGNRAEVARRLRRLDGYAARLRAMVDVVQVSSADANAPDALEATGLADFYRDFRRRHAR
jgi:hypothetical protein